MSVYNTIWNLALRNGLSGPLQQMQTQMSSFSGGGNSMGGMLNGLRSRFAAVAGAGSIFGSTLLSALGPIGAVTAGITGVASAISGAVNAAADYQDNIAELSAITGFAGAELKYLEERAIQTGIKSGLGANQAATAYKLLASNIDVAAIGGVKALDMLQERTITLAKAAGVDLPMAADTMAATINQFQLPATESARVINTLAAGAKYGAAEIPDLAESLKNTAVAAHNAGVSLEQTVGVIEILSQNAIKGGEAGTGLRNVITALQTKLKIDVGKVGIAQALESLQPKLTDVNFLAKTFGRENLNVAQALIQNAGAIQAMTDKVTGTQVAYEQANIRSSTFNESVKRLKAQFEAIAIRIGNFFMPIIEGFINFVGGLIEKIGRFFRYMYDNSFMFRVFIDGISTFFDIIGLVWDDIAFRFETLFFFIKKLTGATDDLNKKMIESYESAQEKALRERGGLSYRETAELERNKQRLVLGMITKEEYVSSTRELLARGQEKLNQIDAEKRLKNEPPPGSTTTTPGKTEPPKANDAGINSSLTSTSSGVSGKGEQIKNINFRTESLVREVHIHVSAVKDGGEEMRRMVQEALIGAIRDTEVAL
ncbi:phage tail tape measure protein [Nodularia spumigena]|jgi:TP901 family phage tail tape measure protein|uniref:phage tail tape measure protein n=1 Tax=Nodularia spumigena TaxID=70799 RepID=UPI00232BC7B0|nr:phage tail tape measure protein [Nodularia spumigena]MDB9498572.1 phage tail tape measure protein [Nodularia spumigena CS-336/02]